jgi:phage baseplate assembly protein W
MAFSYGVRLPLRRNQADGYEMIKTLQANVAQNFKMLVLTNPGERVMDPNYGVGMMGYLFEAFTTSTYSGIHERLQQQVSRYMPIVKIINISFDESGADGNRLRMRIIYSVPQIGFQDFLDVTI